MAYQFIIFALIVQTILFFGHLVLYKAILFFFGITAFSTILWFRIVLGLLFISFIPATFFSSKYSNIVARFFYWLSSSWLGFLNFLFVASVLLWTIYFLTKIFFIPFNQFTFAVVFFVIAVTLGIYGIINANNARIKNISIELPNLPEYWKGKTAVWISDIHLGPVRRYDFAEEVANNLKTINPNMIFFGGDLFDGGTVDLDNFMQPFSKISVSDGIYFITGNHEEFSDETIYLNAVKQAGIRTLDSEMVNIKGLQIIGVGWAEAENRKKYENALNSINLDKNLPSILLKHAPTNLQLADNKGISLQISGHTHVGQIFPSNFITKLVYGGYDYGFNKFGNLQIYTSSGVGTWGPPMRVGNNPEIVIIKFK